MRPHLVVAWRTVAEAQGEPPAPEEEALLSSAARPKRRAEFAAGRAAARAAVAQFTGLQPDAIVILRESGESDGRPYAATRDGSRLPLELSITHADGVAAAAAAAIPLGIDVVAREPLPPSFVEEAFAPGELEAWRALVGDEELAVCTAFAAKEAVLKWLGCGMRVPLRSVVVTPADSPTEAGPFHRAAVRVQAGELGCDETLSASYAEREHRIWMVLAGERTRS